MVGGSVAGLLAARVLSDYADSVVIIDRDDPQVTGARPGVPQGTQLHALLPGGLLQLERLFPGFREQALARGAVEAPPAARRNYLDGRLKVVVPDDADSLAGTRPLLEGLIRQQVLRLPNVKTVTARATGLVFDGAAVTGVRCEVGGVPGVESRRPRGGRHGAVEQALGLAGAGRLGPARHLRRMTVHLNYATALFRRPEIDPGLDGRPGAEHPEDVVGRGRRRVLRHRGRPVDGHDGRLRRRPPGAHRGRLRPPAAGAVPAGVRRGRRQARCSATSRPTTTPTAGDGTSTRCERFPAGLSASVTPSRRSTRCTGRGSRRRPCTRPACRRTCGRGPDLRAPARQFLALQKVVVDAAWSMSTSADLALPHVDGPYPRGYRLSSWVSGQIVAATVTDVPTARRFNEVVSLRAHPSSLATPGVLLGALRANRRAR